MLSPKAQKQSICWYQSYHEGREVQVTKFGPTEQDGWKDTMLSNSYIPTRNRDKRKDSKASEENVKVS